MLTDPLPLDRVALLTPEGRGAVASLCIEGARAVEFVARHFSRKSPLAVGRAHVGHWDNAAAAEGQPATTPEEIVVCRVDAERFEVHCHGGAAAARRILDDLTHDGCAVVAWREWIAAEEADPIRAASRTLLAEARTERTAAILLDQYNGALLRAIREIAGLLDSGRAANAIARLDELLALAGVGSHLVEPWHVVLAGPPNAGKSSMINALVGYRRSIVHDRPGTTRDAVAAGAAFDGWPVELIDTAGLRPSGDPLESAGIERARQQIASADAVLLVFDAAAHWTDEWGAMLGQFPQAIVLHNKIDLLDCRGSEELQIAVADRPPGIGTSAVTGSGLTRLIERLIARLIPNEPPIGAAVPFTATQFAALSSARSCAQRGDSTAAMVALAAISSLPA